MELIAVSLVPFAVAAAPDMRPRLGIVAAAQVAGMAVMYVAVIAEVGRQGSYGDYPAAFGVGLVVAAVLSALGLDRSWSTATTSSLRTAIDRLGRFDPPNSKPGPVLVRPWSADFPEFATLKLAAVKRYHWNPPEH